MFVGIDIGTSVVKAAAFDRDGRILAVERARAPLVAEGDRVEQDFEEVFAAVARVARAVCGGRAPALAGITAQGDGAWPVDAAGRPVRRGISWMDGRAAGIVAEWIADGTAEAVYRATGNTVFPGCAAPLLAWLDRNEPAVLDAAATAAYVKDVAFQRLTGVRATDVSDASVPFLDPRGRDYSPAVLEACGLGRRAGLFAPVHDPLPGAEAVAGGVLPAGTPVAAGPTDVTAAAILGRVAEPGDGLLNIGTSLVCDVVTDVLDLSGEPSGFHFATAEPGRWLRVMAAMVGTAGLDWVLETTGTSHGELDAILDGTAPGAGGVAVLPFFAPSGERSPFVEPSARAEFTGVSLRTTRAELVRAVCEGTAYAARHLLEAAGLRGSVTVCGGGTGSAAWLRMFADVLGRPVRVAAGPETGARGAVLAAADRHGIELDTTAWTRPSATVDPDPGRAAFHERGYADHLDRVARARDRWAARARPYSTRSALES
ncbi:FGGY-family carbohydrate kinase [Actinomadura kijaniata]|uniref:FGGY family carbohydrate kinase n=1 Tax=Actinomadura kijaniata TaxID=46161 RepID=UPI002FEDD793